LESLHGMSQPGAVGTLLTHLGHADRFVRYAARVALEWQPIDSWEHLVLAAEDPVARIEGCVALARCSTARDPHRVALIFSALAQIDWNGLTVGQKLAWLRACELALIRTECHDAKMLHEIGQHLLPKFPTGVPELDMVIGRLLVYCRMPDALPPMLEIMYHAPTQQERIAVAYNLRSALPLMSAQQQSRYLSWFGKLDGVRGGESLRGFLRMIRDDAATSLDDAARQRLAPLLSIAVTEVAAGPIVPTGPVIEEYSVDRVVEIVEQSNAVSSAANARAAFAKALCFHCHRVGDEGGATGPDLTTAHRRFSVRYLAESMVSPDHEISDRFRTSTFLLQDGQSITGRVANMNQDEIRVVTDMLNPGAFTSIDRSQIDEIQPSPASEMPKGLLNVLTPQEIRDLFGFLRSEGKQ
jgi:putative heme-binding domain-containing protein